MGNHFKQPQVTNQDHQMNVSTQSEILVELVKVRAELNGFEVKTTEQIFKAPWQPYSTHTWTWFLTKKKSNQPEGPVFECSKKPLPTSSKSEKFSELKNWAKACSEYITQNKRK
jgi:hypothetical protein